MTLHVEEYIPMDKKWVQLGALNPGEQPGSFSQKLSDGREEFYLFLCESDKESKLLKTRGGMNMAISESQRMYVAQGYEEVAILREGEEYILTIHPQNPNIGAMVRFTHKQP